MNLKIGSLIMLLRNLNTKRGLCNGTRLIAKNLLQADILGQPIRRRVQHKFQHLVKLVNIERKTPETLSLCTAAN
jgi:hypothetical protein